MPHGTSTADRAARRLRDGLRLSLPLSICMLLAACGGGGGGSTPLSISGTAATGAALADASVQIKCASGTGTATTAANGSFSVVIPGAALPCVLEATGGTTKLHSLIESGAGSTVKANITPLSELLLARLAGAAPATLFETFDAAAQAKLTASALGAARTSLIAGLDGVVDLNNVDPLKDTLVIGNPLDQLLDTLAATLLLAQTTLQDLALAVATSGATTSPVSALLKPAAATCAALRSGTYRAIFAYDRVDLSVEPESFVFTIDAQTLTGTDPFEPGGFALTPVDNAPCKFTAPGDFGPDSDTILVAKSGMQVVRSLSNIGQPRTRFVIPEQTVPLSELVGTWNYLEYWPDDNTQVYAPFSGTFTIDDGGRFAAVTECTGLDNCASSDEEPSTLVAEPSGGFSIAGGTEGTRVFAFKTASGKLALFIINPTIGGVTVATKQAALSLPEVGRITNTWDFAIGSDGFASPVLDDITATVASVDTVAGSYTRERASDGRIDGFTVNQPRDGFRNRVAGSSTTNSGGTVSFPGILVMPLADTGVTFYSSVDPADNFFGVAVVKP